jgi:hypothetical protein
MRKDFCLLDAEIRNCQRCAEILAKSPEDPPATITIVRPHPVLSKPSHAPIMLVGQSSQRCVLRIMATSQVSEASIDYSLGFVIVVLIGFYDLIPSGTVSG